MFQGFQYLISYEPYDEEPKYLAICNSLYDAKIYVSRLNDTGINDENFVENIKSPLLSVIEFNIGDTSYMIRKLHRFTSDA